MNKYTVILYVLVIFGCLISGCMTAKEPCDYCRGAAGCITVGAPGYSIKPGATIQEVIKVLGTPKEERGERGCRILIFEKDVRASSGRRGGRSWTRYDAHFDGNGVLRCIHTFFCDSDTD